GLEELKSHLLGKPALMKLQSRHDNDDGTARIIDALTQKVLTEAALLTLEHVTQRLQRTLVGSSDGLAAAAVVKESVHRLLKHPTLVANDDFRSIQLKETAQTIVAVDDSAIKIIQIARRETSTIKGNKRTKIWRKHRNHMQHHPLRAITAPTKRLDDLKSLREFLLFGLTCGRVQFYSKSLTQ